MASLSRFHCGSECLALLSARPAGYHSGHVSACSSNEKCLAVNEINTDIRLAQQELRGTGEGERKKRSMLAGEMEEGDERGHGEKDDVKEQWK